MKGLRQKINLLACRAWCFTRTFWKLWNENQVSIRAAALTYTFILSLVPALAICLWFFTLFADITSLQAELKNFLLKNLATGTGEAVVQLLDKGLRNVRFKSIGYAGLGGMFVTGIFLLAAIQDSMNQIWRVKNKQRVWTRVLLYQAFFSLGPISIAIAMVATTFLVKFFPSFIYPARIASILISASLFAVMYKLLPVAPVNWKNASISGLLAASATEIAKAIYTVYTARALFYSKVYGGLAALPFFLIWIYLNWTIFLAGTQINYILDHWKALTTRKDS